MTAQRCIECLVLPLPRQLKSRSLQPINNISQIPAPSPVLSCLLTMLLHYHHRRRGRIRQGVRAFVMLLPLFLLLNSGSDAFRLPCPTSSSLPQLSPQSHLRCLSRLPPKPRQVGLSRTSLPSLLHAHSSSNNMMSSHDNDSNNSPSSPVSSPTPEEENNRKKRVLTSLSLSRLLTRAGGVDRQPGPNSLRSSPSFSRHRPFLRRLLARLHGSSPSSFSPPSSSSPSFLSRLQTGMSEHDGEILRISLPALLTLLVDPFLSLCDTAYVARVGTIALASLGPCTSIFHLSFNGFRAFSQSTTSLVSSSLAVGDKKRVRAVVLQALVLASALGSLVAFFLYTRAPIVLSLMGAPPSSLLARTGLPYLKTRALAAPAVLTLMVCEGAYRGFGDTLTPLPVTFLVAAVNIILDPLLIFGGRGLGWGVAGAAWATVIAQYVGIVAYLCLLFGKGKTSPLYRKKGGKKGEEVDMVPVVEGGMAKRRWREEEEERRKLRLTKKGEDGLDGGMGDGMTPAASSSSIAAEPLSSLLPSFVSAALPTFLQLLRANGAMLIRNGTLMLVWAYATATATRMSTLDVAAHQVALSIWLFFALVSEAPGIAAQVMAARLYSTRNLAALRSLARRLASLGLTLGTGLGGILIVLRRSLPQLFASDPQVLGKVSELMVLLGAQLPLVALTLIGESFLVGCGKFGALAMCSTLTSGACALVLRWLGRGGGGGGGGGGVVYIWWAIKGLFVMRLTCVAWLMYNPWKGTLSGKGSWRRGGKGGKEEEGGGESLPPPPPRLLLVE